MELTITEHGGMFLLKVDFKGSKEQENKIEIWLTLSEALKLKQDLDECFD